MAMTQAHKVIFLRVPIELHAAIERAIARDEEERKAELEKAGRYYWHNPKSATAWLLDVVRDKVTEEPTPAAKKPAAKKAKKSTAKKSAKKSPAKKAKKAGRK